MSSSKFTSQQGFLGAGHHDQVHQLYTEHHAWLHGWLRKKLGCSEQAADLSQDTFVKVLKKQYPLELLAPRSYLTTIAHSLVVNHWRRKDIERNYLEAIVALPIEELPSVERRAIILETLVRIDQALNGLPNPVREAFLFSQLHGLTYKLIAERLDVSERTVKNYMARAMLHCLIIAESDE